MTSKALEAAVRKSWESSSPEYRAETFDDEEDWFKEGLTRETAEIIRAFAQNLSDEAAEAASSVRYQKATAFLPDMNKKDHKRAITRCIQAAIEKDLE